MNNSQYDKEKEKEEISYFSIFVFSILFSAICTGITWVLSRVVSLEVLKNHEPLEFFLFYALVAAIVIYFIERSVVKEMQGKS